MMTTTPARMQPLPVVIPDVVPAMPAPAAAPAGPGTRMMQPLPVPAPELAGPADAATGAALERMLERLGVKQPLPVVHPT